MGFAVNAVSVLYIMAFIVIFCFPFNLPVAAKTMNYAALITGGCTLFVGAWWAVRRRGYVGPQLVPVGEEHLAKDAM